MRAKRARKIRQRLSNSTPVPQQGEVSTTIDKSLYRLAKKIWVKYKVMPKDVANG